jgi:hypothetical protein
MLLHYYYLFAAVIMIVAVNPTHHVMAVSSAAFALPPPSSAASNEIPGSIIDGGKSIEWMDDWMLRFGGVARYVALQDMNRHLFIDLMHHTYHGVLSNDIFQIVRKQGQ